MKKELKYIDISNKPNGKPIELQYELEGGSQSEGWEIIDRDQEDRILKDCNKITYIGKCEIDGDMFVVEIDGFIKIFKGELNSGVLPEWVNEDK